jgi:hypothetical protein
VVTEEARGLVRRVARKGVNPWSTYGIYLFIYYESNKAKAEDVFFINRRRNGAKKETFYIQIYLVQLHPQPQKIN